MVPMLLRIVTAVGLTAFSLLTPMHHGHVHDFAAILSVETESQLEAELLKIEQETTAEVAVVTVDSLEGKDVDEFAHELFNRWGIGQKNVNNGVLFLIAPNDRRARIEVGYGLEPLLTDSLSGEILDNDVIPKFKQEDYEGGVKAGTRVIVDLLRRYPDAARGIAGSAPSFVFTPRKRIQWLGYIGLGLALLTFLVGRLSVKRKSYSPTLFFIAISSLLAVSGLLIFAASKINVESLPIGTSAGAVGTGLMALFYNIRRFRRFRPHHCNACRTQMRLLDDKEDDGKLSKEELLEEKLGSIDYDVWICPACLKEHREDYKAFMSNFSACPECKRKTYSERSTTTVMATEYSTGLRRIDGECKNCWHKTTRTEVVPRITRSSSSSSGSSGGGGGGGFGGGSSGGGGSSRGW